MMPWRKAEAKALTLQSVARSHVGRVRPINEDRVFDCAERRLWAVADGMGGHSGGDLAAQAVVDAFRAVAESDAVVDCAAMLAAIRRANVAIVDRNDACSTDAGSTVVAAQVSGSTATIAWVGDSRAYLFRDGAAKQLSHDHSVVQELVDAGLLTLAAAARHPRANVVTRALGVAPVVDIATVTVDLKAGDRVLLCSDGLSRSMPMDALDCDVTLDILSDILISDALDNDGSDNISLVLLELV